MRPAADSTRRDRSPRRPPRERLVELPDGRHISVRRRSGEGLPVVLLHGLLDSAAGWDELVADLPNPASALDLPGFGASDMPTRPRVSAYAEDVIATLDRLDVDEFVLVGHSLGGAVAAAVAERIPGRVRSLLLMAPAGFGRIGLAETISVPGFRNLVARALPLALANPLVLTAAYTRVVTNGLVLDPDLRNRVMRRAFESMPGAREATRAVVAAGLSERGFRHRRLPYFGPVRVVWGDHDRLVPIAHVAGVHTALPQARVEVWDGMGHHPQRERPERLARLVLDLCAAASAAVHRTPARAAKAA